VKVVPRRDLEGHHVTIRESTSVGRKISKSPTGIRGLDEITGGGLPTGRPTLVCGQRRLR
jgi:RecA/RadA recombinase